MGPPMRAAAAFPLLLTLLAVAARAGDPPTAVEANEAGIAHMLAGEAEAAVRSFEDALGEATGHPVVARNLAAALAEAAAARRAARAHGSAVALREEAVRLPPWRLRYRVLLGRARFEEGTTSQRQAARDDFATVLARDADHLDALVNLGQICYLERQLEEAVRLWRHADALRPDDGDIRARLARAERELEVERAYETLESASFRLRYAPAIPRDQAEAVLRLCEEAYGDLAARFRAWPARVSVTLYPPAEFRSATLTHGWVAGLSDGTIRLTVPVRSRPADLRAGVVHELAHHFIRARAPQAPVWLHEGLAQMAEGRDAREAEARLRVQGEPRAAELAAGILGQADPRLVSRFYDMTLAFCRHLEERRGPAGIDDLLRRLGEGAAKEEALTQVFRQGRDDPFAAWLRRLRGR